MITNSVPTGWATAHLGEYFRQRQEPGIPGLPTFSVTLNDGLVLRDQIERRTDSSLSADEHLLVKAGDIAYNMMRMWQGACGLAQRDGVVSPAYVVLIPNERIDGKFAYHWFKSNRGLYSLWAYSHGLTDDRLRLYFDDFCQVPINLPPIDEQRRIAQALDAWDQAIERAHAVVVAKQRRIRSLILAYCNEFAHQKCEFGEITKLISERGEPAPGEAGKSVELENIESHTGRILGSTGIDSTTGVRSRFSSGDTLFGKLRPYLRKFAQPAFDGMCSTEIWVLRAKPAKCDPTLLFYLVQTPEFLAAATKQSGSRMPRSDWDLVSSAPVPLPTGVHNQRKVALRLSIASNDAILSMQELDILRRQKRAIAQQLLTGSRRLGIAKRGAEAA